MLCKICMLSLNLLRLKCKKNTFFKATLKRINIYNYFEIKAKRLLNCLKENDKPVHMYTSKI